MSAGAAAAPQSMRAGVVGGVVFVVSDGLTFAALLGAAVALRAARRDWPAAHASVTQLALLTILLFAGSAAIALSRRLARPRLLLVAAVLGIAFVATEMIEWRALLAAHQGPSADLRHASLFVVTGLHALHVAVGALALVRLGMVASSDAAVRVLSFYWLALDLAWVGIVAALYA